MTPLPECTLAELLNQARRAIKWLHAHVARMAATRRGSISAPRLWAMSRPCSPASMRQCGLPHDVIKSATWWRSLRSRAAAARRA